MAISQSDTKEKVVEPIELEDLLIEWVEEKVNKDNPDDPIISASLEVDIVSIEPLELRYYVMWSTYNVYWQEIDIESVESLVNELKKEESK